VRISPDWAGLILLVRGESTPRGLEATLRASLWPAVLGTLLSAPYGATIGLWTSPRLALYAAAKLPLLMLLTAALTFAACWVIARLAGWPLGPGVVASLIFLPLAVASLILASLAPVSALLSLSAPAPAESARLTHNLLYLAHTFLVGGASLAGTATLLRLLKGLAANGRRAGGLFAAWLAIYAIVGGEVAWALRPFVGSVYEDVQFLRPNALEGNVYEFVLEDIVPYVASPARIEGGSS